MTEYSLSNAEELNRNHPETFWIPSIEERTSIRNGKTAKLIFDNRERMWVQVTGRTDTGYTGILVSKPVGIETIDFHDDVVFGPEHVIDIE